MPETYKKIDDNTVEITTTTEAIETKVEHNKAEIETELAHAPDRLAKLQENLDEENASNTRLANILKVFN